MEEVYLKVEKCKICNGEYKEVNKSHVRAKHNMTWEEYQAYNKITPVQDQEKIQTIWDSVNIDSIEFKVRHRALSSSIPHIRNNECVDLRNGKICHGCKRKIHGISVFIILYTYIEMRTNKPEHMKKPYHKDCAIAVADSTHRIGVVLNPIKTD